MIFLGAASSASAIPGWLAIAGAAVGLAGGIGGAAVSVLSVRNARYTLRETRLMPVRQRQHELIDRLVGELPELLSALDAVNLALQERDGGAATRSAMETLEQVTRRMTTPEVTDPELRQRLEKLADAVLSRDGMGQNFVDRLHSFAGLMDRLNEARQQFAQGPVDTLIDLAAQRGREQEPLRHHNGQVAMATAKDVGERLREIQRDGLGEIQSGRRLWRPAVRLRLPGHRQSPTP